jgi:hypothetical protein
MRLSGDRHKLVKMAAGELAEAIAERRAVIRAHRDAKGDDRCWIDDLAVWRMVDGLPADAATLPSFDEGMRRCAEFYRNRRAEAADVGDAAIASGADADIPGMAHADLVKCLTALQSAIRAHFDVKDRPRTLDDDRTLYAVLPEKVAPDFRLPPEGDFLGEGKAPHAGCPSFWRSHSGCTAERHNLHCWGPCKGEAA